MNNTKNIECVRRYHQQTKHSFGHYASGPETLDWSQQPDPFRTYAEAEKIALPFAKDNLNISYCDLYTPDKVTPQPVSLPSIGTILELSMGLSAWKEYMGDRWALRCNPSSGNLHPTEAYVVGMNIDGLTDGVYHYMSYDHTLEQRCAFVSDKDTSNTQQEPFLFIGLSSIFWREAWKYGERAYRYCQLDVGHAIAAIRYACALQGWSAEIVADAGDDAIDQLLGLNREQDFGSAEREHADLLISIKPQQSESRLFSIDTLMKYSQEGEWHGKANILDKHHLYDWPIIDEVAQASRLIKGETTQRGFASNYPPPLSCNTTLQAKTIIQRRRSAQMFDGVTAIDSEDFFRLLDMLTPRANTPPWDAFPWQPRMHLVLFVHRVNGLEPGLYIMLRNDEILDSLQSSLSDKMEWSRVVNAPEHLNLYRLIKARSQKAAATLSCHQRIASDSAFSAGMLSEFDAALAEGPCTYNHLYWEAGMIGQVLYLEAEAFDLQGTGIGCFFDDPVHEMLGIKDTQFQSLYHFTVGGALNDSRLRTIMPYEHLNR